MHIHPSIALQDFDQALALKQQEATVGERLQKAKIRCQATEATKPIDLEEVHLWEGTVGGNLGENSNKKYECKTEVEWTIQQPRAQLDRH